MSLDLRDQDPASARFNAVSVAVVLALVGCIVGFVSAALLFGSSPLARWFLVLSGAVVGVVPLLRWRRSQRSSRHVDLFGVEPSLRPLVIRAVEAAERIERAAAAAPPGAVADTLADNHRSALAHVRLVSDDAQRVGTAYRTELLRHCHQLDELAASSERLLHRAMRAQPTVLNALVERTELLGEALTPSELQFPELSEASDERDPEDRDATNDR